jgi:hypothetical protein
MVKRPRELESHMKKALRSLMRRARLQRPDRMRRMQRDPQRRRRRKRPWW